MLALRVQIQFVTYVSSDWSLPLYRAILNASELHYFRINSESGQTDSMAAVADI
jgi:hypothetical protein